MTECIQGGYYKINSRNLGYGVYDVAHKGFHGIRSKFGDTYVFTEYHWDTGPPNGTVKPLEFIKQCPFDWEDYGDLEEWLMNELEMSDDHDCT